MDLLYGKVRSVYFHYLTAAFGSALISSIYGLVDTAMVGQYQGPEGTAALAVVAPIWNIIYSLGLLTGIGGSILFGTSRGGEESRGSENQFFTAALLETAGLALVCWAAILLFEEPMLRLFGANEALLPLAKEYLLPIKFVVPLFMFNQMLSAFLRNDGAPALATIAVLAGGIFNVFGDYFFVFTLDYGIMGAGLATAIGAGISFLILLSHFFSKGNTLRLTSVTELAGKLRQITVSGFSSFFIDVAMGLLTMMFNRQIMLLAGPDALSVYGIIVNISTIVQCCAYSVGQAAQPVISISYGAGQFDRIREVLRYALCSAGFFALVWTGLILLFPNTFVYIFMAPTAEVLHIAPAIMRCYGLSFLLLPVNIFSTYYFQSIMRPGISFGVAVSRGLVISGVLIHLLPALFGPTALWLSMPVTELMVAIGVAVLILRCTRALTRQGADSAA
ncbi:MAG: multidrug transporter MatE [Clostridiales bacterium]|nr:multidrug transporter MatE [Clostridiales bacterium]